MGRKFIVFGLGLYIFLSYPSAYSFETFPEFGSLSETEQESFDDPKAIGSEYQSDILAYTRPFNWQYEFLSHKNAFNYGAGSITGNRFMMDNHIKLNKKALDWLDIRLTYLQEQHRDREEQRIIPELLSWLTPKWGVSFYLEMESYKRKNDVGFAVLYKPSPTHEIRLFSTYVDIVRNSRNDRDDRIVDDNAPTSRGLVGRWYMNPEDGREEFVEYAVRYESTTEWHFPSSGYEYWYRKQYALLRGRMAFGLEQYLNLAFQYDWKFEGRATLGTTTGEFWNTRRYLATLQWESGSFTYGLQYASRNWESTSGNASHMSFLPHFWWKTPAFMGGDKDFWRLGYELTYFRPTGPDAMRTEPIKDEALEHRLNIGYGLNMFEKARLVLYLTFDLDTFFTGTAFQGGNGQFQMFF